MGNSLSVEIDSIINKFGFNVTVLDSTGGAKPILRSINTSLDLGKINLKSIVSFDEKLHFKLATNEVQDEVRKSFMLHKSLGSFEKKIDINRIKRVTNKNLHDLSVMTSAGIKNLANEGLSHIEELGVITSGAGLWSRGGGSVKALVPYNISTLLGTDFLEIAKLGKVVAANNSEEIFKLSNINSYEINSENIERKAFDIKNHAMEKIKILSAKTIYQLDAINSIDMKFVNLACVFVKTGKYISFDIWTSEQTHKTIQDYVDWLQHNIYRKVFHPDTAINNDIKRSLEKYFKKSRDLGETHLFGYQEGLHAIDVRTGTFRYDTPAIGKGAGSIIKYLENSGRMNVLRSHGKKTLVFENIEVVSDYAPLFASHRRSAKPVSVVLVPQKNGYIGGSPFLVKKADGDWNIELLEQSVLNEKFKNDNQYFNTNTIFFSTEVKTPETLSFEMKDQNTIARVKQNMGDVTFDNSTHGIGGRLGHDQKMVEYENFKSFDEYGENGGFYIETFQNRWKEMILQ